MKRFFIIVAVAMLFASCSQNYNELKLSTIAQKETKMTQEERARKVVMDMLNRIDPQTRGSVRKIVGVEFISFEQIFGGKSRTESDSIDWRPNPTRQPGFIIVDFEDSTGFAVVAPFPGVEGEIFPGIGNEENEDSEAVGLLAITDSGNLTTEEVLSYGDEWTNNSGGNDDNSGSSNENYSISGLDPESYLIYLAVNYTNRCYQHDGTYVDRAPNSTTGFYKRGPLLVTEWSQRSPFNNYFPSFNEHELQVAGCTTIAVAQMLTYLKDISLEDCFNISSSTWENIEDVTCNCATTIHSDNTAKMVKQIADKIQVTYRNDKNSTSGSNENVKNCFIDYGYSVTTKKNVNLTKRVGNIVNCININKPVYISGFSNSAGHAWVIDGYMHNSDSNDEGDIDSYYLHCNFGWGGSSNGWYFMNIFNNEDNDDYFLDNDGYEVSFDYYKNFYFIFIN